MKAILCVPLLIAPFAWADEAADRGAIDRVIVALNEPSQGAAPFTEDGNAASELSRLRRINPPFRIVGPVEAAIPAAAVTISREPWGEARINLVAGPRIAGQSIVFITADVALAKAVCEYQDGSAALPTTPLLFVMKKEGEGWRIASLQTLAPR